MKDLFDWIARNLGYYTSADVAACVRSAGESIQDRSHALLNSEACNTKQTQVELMAIPADYIRYFVSYSWSADRGVSGFGNIEIGRAQTIRSQEDIRLMVDLIADTLKGSGFQNPSVVVLNWQPFEPPRHDDGGRETVEDGMPSTVVLRLVA